MYDIPSQTMYSYLNNPMLEKFSFQHLSVSNLAQEIENYQNKNNTIAPESEALKFYLMSHGFHLIRAKYSPLEHLPDKVANLVETHISTTDNVAKRLFYYIILISIEEARFVRDKKDFGDYLSTSFGQEFGDYAEGKFEGSLTDFKKLNINIGKFLSGITTVFHSGSWSPGFGGKPWAGIINLAKDTAMGKQSFEVMADLAFSLCHNNGSMFNKGKLYHMYTEFIYEILDIQASGQIPQWIGDNLNNRFVTPEIKNIFNDLKSEFPEEFSLKLDKKIITDSSKKRKEKENQKAIQLQALWASQGNYNANNESHEIEPKKAKIDTMLIDTFKQNKLIK